MIIIREILQFSYTNKMKLSISQPAYIPWLGYFDRIGHADLHIVLDHVQFERRSFISRNKLQSNTGTQWITIPVSKGKNGEDSINVIKTLNNEKWIKTHLKTITQNYSKAPFFEDYFEEFSDLLKEKTNENNIVKIIEPINFLILKFLNIKTPIIYSSKLGIKTKKSDLIRDICLSQEATEYFSGTNGKDYLNLQSFSENNIKVAFQEYNHPVYYQGQRDFQPYLSILDLIFYHGKESLEILRKGRNFT